MIGVDFEVRAAVTASAPTRADVACFVGHVARRESTVPEALLEFLHSEGVDLEADDPLLDVPVPIDSWDLFDHLFAWELRPLLSAAQAAAQGYGAAAAASAAFSSESYLGASVRAFFRQGGRRCWVVRVGDPWPYAEPLAGALRDAAVDRLIPGYAGRPAHPRDRASFRGAGHVYGLPDVSFVSVPDLVELFRTQPPEPSLLVPAPPGPVGFVECSEPVEPPTTRSRLRFLEPRLGDDTGLAEWASALSMLARLVAQRRDVQLVASAPLSAQGTLASRHLLEALVDLDRSASIDDGGVASAFLQLGWPWLSTDASDRLPGGLEPPEGAIIGTLSRSVLLSGAFHSAAGQGLRGVRSLEPELGLAERRRPTPWGERSALARLGLEHRITLVSQTPRGFVLLSDVTTSASESYRAGAVQRLTSVLVRTARRVGEDLVFESSGEALWSAVRDRLQAVLLALWHEGALAGADSREAFEVVCDRSVMTQNDIDSGRVVCSVSFQPAAPIERITVVLSLGGASVSVTSGGEA
jgi:hypothetical protein